MFPQGLKALFRSIILVALLILSPVSQADQVRSVDDYTVTTIRDRTLSETEAGPTKVNVTQRIYDALFETDIAGKVVSNDLSRHYLGLVFGEVPGSLQGDVGVVGLLFRIFNIGLLAIAGTLVIYTTVFGMSASAHEGGALGSGRFNGWAISRVIGSLTLLVPTSSGYSYAQIMVMKVALGGVVAANTMWEASIDFLNQEGSDSAFSWGNASTGEDEDFADKLLGNSRMTRGEEGDRPFVMALNMPKQKYVDYRFAPSNDTKGNYLLPINQAIVDVINIVRPCREIFPGVLGVKSNPLILIDREVDKTQVAPNNITLNVKLQIVSQDVSAQIRGFEITGLNEFYANLLFDYISDVSKDLLIEHRAVKKRSKDVVGAIFAKHLRKFYNLVKYEPPPLREQLEVGRDLVISLKQSGWISAGYKFRDLYKFDKSASQPEIKYFSQVFPIDAKIRSYEYIMPSSSTNPRNILKTAEVRMGPGDRVLTLDDNAFVGVLDRKNYVAKVLWDTALDVREISAQYRALYLPSSIKAMGEDLIEYMKSAYLKLVEKQHGVLLRELSELSVFPGVTIDTGVVVRQIQAMAISVSKAIFALMLQSDGTTPIQHESCNLVGGDPLETISLGGRCIISAASTYFSESRNQLYAEVTSASWKAFGISTGVQTILGTVKALAVSKQTEAKAADKRGDTSEKNKKLAEAKRYGAMGTVTSMISDPILSLLEFSQAAAKTIISIYLPLGNGLAVTYMTAGAVLAAYVPFVPTLIFLFAVIAWLFAVIEAMIAAPIVMIGFANPEGHDVIGKAEQGIMLMLGVFVRPMVTLIGFLLAMTLSFSLLGLFNDLFSLSMLVFVRSVFHSMSGDQYALPLLFVLSGIVVLYAYSVLVIVEQCYAMIYVIPDQILKWIGGPLDSAGGAIGSALRNVSSGLSQQSAKASQGISQSSGGAMGVNTRG